MKVGFAMVRDGSFSIPKDRGVLPGEYSVKVVNQGDVTHRQTIEDIEVVAGENLGIRFLVTGKNDVLTIELK